MNRKMRFYLETVRKNVFFKTLLAKWLLVTGILDRTQALLQHSNHAREDATNIKHVKKTESEDFLTERPRI